MTTDAAPFFPCRAALRRALALRAGAARLELVGPLASDALAGEPGGQVAFERLLSYLLDPRAGTLLAVDPTLAAWLARPLFTWVGPGNAVPVDDQVAALVIAPALTDGDALLPLITRYRFAPRADDLVGVAIAALELPVQAAALERLFAEPGPDAATLALSTVQCGRVLGWAPHLLEWPIAERIVDALLALLVAARPRPLLDAVAGALGPLAGRGGALAAKIRAAATAALGPPPRSPGGAGSFLAEVARVGRARTLPDEDRLRALPGRDLAAAAATILGHAAPADREAFFAHRAAVLERPDAGDLVAPFLDGLCAGAHVPALAELVRGSLGGSPADARVALALAARVPLDPAEDALLAALDAPRADLRARACAAVTLLDTPRVDEALALRLGDPAPEVAAAAARALRERGQDERIGQHGAREPNPTRQAIAFIALGELSVAVVGQLTVGGLAAAEDPEADADALDPSPLTALLAECLLATGEGLEIVAELVEGVPEMAGLLALAASAADTHGAALQAPPGPRAALGRAVRALVARAAAPPEGGADAAEDDDARPDPELAALAYFLLAHVSAGDGDLAAEIAAALTATAGDGGPLLGALAALRVATPQTAAALAPLLAEDAPLGARVLAAAAAGRALPDGHPAWAEVRGLLELGTIARAAAWAGLRDLARRQAGG